MGQKVNPTGLRLGVNRTWDSRWYADDKFTDYLHEDLKIKEFLKEKLAQAGISRIVIERPHKKARVTINSAIFWKSENLNWMHNWLPTLLLNSWKDVLLSAVQ